MTTALLPERLAGWVARWATPAGIPLRVAAELEGWSPERPLLTPVRPTAVANRDPRTDYGRLHHLLPACVLEPRTPDELAACVRRLSARRIPFTVRGAGNSAGGQVLSDGGVVIATARLRGIVADHPAEERVRVLGGTLWAEVMRHLTPQGRRPPVVTGNLLTSVGGTLSAGGIGSTSLLHGMQVGWVTGLSIVLPGGDVVRAGPGDDLFRYTLAGAGQLGVIAEAELATVRRPPRIRVRLFRWDSIADFCASALRIRETGRFEVFGARWFHPAPGAPGAIAGKVGGFHPDGAPLRGQWQLWEEEAIPDEGGAPELTRGSASPSLHFLLPLPAGIGVWEEVAGELSGAGVTAYAGSSSPLGVLRRDARFPLAPFPDADDALFFGIWPEVPLAELDRVLEVLRSVAERVLRAGGKLVLTCSVRPEGEALERQLGAAAPAFRALKARVDPHCLLNPGLL